MEIKVNIDLEDLVYDMVRDEEWNLSEALMASIKSQVVREIKEHCKTSIEITIKSYIEERIGELVKTSFNEWLDQGNVKYNGKDIPLQEYLNKLFTERTGCAYNYSVRDYVENFAKGFAKDLKDRYDLTFAALIVKNMQEQKLLCDEKLAELTKQ